MNDKDICDKAKLFKTELDSLLSKYKVGVYESDQYDGEENYCGSEYYLTFEGETWFGETIEELMKITR